MKLLLSFYLFVVAYANARASSLWCEDLFRPIMKVNYVDLHDNFVQKVEQQDSLFTYKAEIDSTRGVVRISKGSRYKTNSNDGSNYRRPREMIAITRDGREVIVQEDLPPPKPSGRSSSSDGSTVYKAPGATTIANVPDDPGVFVVGFEDGSVGLFSFMPKDGRAFIYNLREPGLPFKELKAETTDYWDQDELSRLFTGSNRTEDIAARFIIEWKTKNTKTNNVVSSLSFYGIFLRVEFADQEVRYWIPNTSDIYTAKQLPAIIRKTPTGWN